MYRNLDINSWSCIAVTPHRIVKVWRKCVVSKLDIINIIFISSHLITQTHEHLRTETERNTHKMHFHQKIHVEHVTYIFDYIGRCALVTSCVVDSTHKRIASYSVKYVSREQSHQRYHLTMNVSKWWPHSLLLVSHLPPSGSFPSLFLSET